MDIAAVSRALPSGPGEITPVAAPETARAGETPFSKLMSDALKDARQQHQVMDQDITNLAVGKADNVHEIVLNVAEADLMFRMLMEVRDRLISSYQEIMRMQI